MIPTATALRSLTPMVARSGAQAGLRAGAIPRPQAMRVSQVGLGARRWNTEENKGGRAKLIFRFGLRDIPVELYPMAFVVAAACVGAAFAVGRHFYLDGLRLGPSRKEKEAAAAAGH